MIEQYFQQLGYSAAEARIYLVLAELGKATAGLVAKKTGFPRSTVYSLLSSLIKKGLVSMEEAGETTCFIPHPPETIKRRLELERENALKLYTDHYAIAEELIKAVTPHFQSTHFSIPKLRFFDGTKNVENMLYEYTPLWRQAISNVDWIWWGFQDHTFVEQYRTYLGWVWKQFDAKEKVQLLSNEATVERELKGKVRGRNIRPMGELVDLASTLWVLGDYIVVIMTRQKPHYAFQIQDSVFASSLRDIFKVLWRRKP